MLDTAFAALATSEFDLYPAELRDGIDAMNAWTCPCLDNGVYRAGFAADQRAYAKAYADVFGALARLEDRLARRGPYVFSPRFTETDIRVFVTLVRFDAVHHGLFTCNERRLVDYPAFLGYIRRVIALPGVAATVNFGHIKRNYCQNYAANPRGIVPISPELAWAAAPERARQAPARVRRDR